MKGLGNALGNWLVILHRQWRHGSAHCGLTFLLLGAALLLPPVSRAADLVPFGDLGLRVQRGFNIRMVADNDTAPDTWCMTFDSRGRLLVANSQSIRVLTDVDGDGMTDTATVFAPLSKGAMGMCSDGTALYAIADGALLRFNDADGNGVADGPPETLLQFGFGEHGAHAIRKGPDGWFYIIGGNDTGWNEQHVSAPDSPIRKIEGGALLRFGPNGQGTECIAQGFRNCYDFDFNALGDIFTYDSDTERDIFLPWYLPTRIYQAGFAQHHGWRLTGYKRSWPRPEYYEDTVNPLWRVGRGSPTGVTVYRHVQFPPAYRDGLFFCDWTFGRVFFMPLQLHRTAYTPMQPEVFVEPLGLQGFAPSDVAVSTDGALYVSIGGRKTRGGVYRIEYGGTAAPPLLWLVSDPELNAVLNAPQPLDAWSRASWFPLAQRLGAQPLAQIALDESVSPVPRVRAIEVLTEVFGGVPAGRVAALAQSPVPQVRARLAWSLGRNPSASGALLGSLATDASPFVRRAALEALIEHPNLVPSAALARAVTANWISIDKPLRMAATRLASRSPDDAWQEIMQGRPLLPVAARNSAMLAQMWRTPDTLLHPELVAQLTNALAQTRDAAIRLDTVRLAILALGDWHLNDPSVEVFTGYEPPAAVPNEFAALLPPLRSIFPSGDAELDTELARLLAMLQDESPRTARVLAQSLTDSSPASQDFHFLVCLARLRAPLGEYAPRIASAILNLDRKLAGQELRTKQSWDARLVELVQQLIRREPSVAEDILRNPRFPVPAHVELAAVFTGKQKVAAARRFEGAVRNTRGFPWTSQLVDLLGELPHEDVFPMFRRMVNYLGVRDAIVLEMAKAPAVVDRPIFLGSLASTQPQVVRASLEALLKLPPDATGTNLIAPLRLLRKALSEPPEILLRAQVMALLSTSLKQKFNVDEPLGADPDLLKTSYQPVFDAVGRRYPGLIRGMNADDGEDPARWANLLRTAPWKNGDAVRGADIFAQRGCTACHTAGGAIGPDLVGVSQRMSRDDVLNAIAFPSRDIAPAYRATLFHLRDGQTINGIIAFESADGWIVQTGAGTSARIDSRDVVSQQPSSVSPMPAGLLAGLSPLGVADLYAYLASIPARDR